MIDYFRTRSKGITFKILSSNTLAPEIIQINSGPTITILSDTFFTNIACHLPLDGLSHGPIPDTSHLDHYITTLPLLQNWKYNYMKQKVLTISSLEKYFFKKIATLVEKSK